MSETSALPVELYASDWHVEQASNLQPADLESTALPIELSTYEGQPATPAHIAALNFSDPMVDGSGFAPDNSLGTRVLALMLLAYRPYGGPKETRTLHLLHAMETLYQMSYRPVVMVELRGIEPPTLSLQTTCSSAELQPHEPGGAGTRTLPHCDGAVDCTVVEPKRVELFTSCMRSRRSTR